MSLWARSSLAILLACTVPASAAPDLRTATNTSATPADQLVVAGNACGPAALLNAFRFGNEDWQKVAAGISGTTDKERIYTIIREVAMRPSKHIKGRPRWSRKGVNLADLRDIGNEMTAGKYLPVINEDVFFRKKGETPEDLLKRVHKRFETSLAKGLPPIVSLRRYALRRSEGKPPEWVVLDAHFVTLSALPRKLDKGARSFPITYIDPWGGKVRTGSIGIASKPLLSADPSGAPCLEAVLPQSAIGKKLVKPGEPNALAVAAALGRW